MEEEWKVLACPSCHSALWPTGSDGLGCAGCGRSFPIQNRVPALLRPEDAARLAIFSHQYRQDRLRDNWQPMTPETALALPFGHPSGYPPLYWEVRRQSYRALMQLLAREGPPPEAGPIADLGAGTGWLSYRLAQAGYRVLALDASLDEFFGLGAAEVYLASASFLRVQGDLEHPPLLTGKLCLIIFNASLHYAGDLEGTLCRSAQILQPGGRWIALDTPITRQPRPGTGRGDRHLGRRVLHEALLNAGLRPRWIAIRRGVRWWLYQAKAWLKRESRFSFPMVVADRNDP